MTMTTITAEIERIKARNKQVEGDKAWETSWSRKGLIVVFTYVVLVIFFHFAGLSKPFINSLVPAGAFILSTLTFSFFKKMWLQKFYLK